MGSKSRSRYHHNTTAQSWPVQRSLAFKTASTNVRIRMECVRHPPQTFRTIFLPNIGVSPFAQAQYTSDACEFTNHSAITIAGLEDRTLFYNYMGTWPSPRRREHNYVTGRAVVRRNRNGAAFLPGSNATRLYRFARSYQHSWYDRVEDTL